MTNNYYSLMLNAYEDSAGNIDSPDWDSCPEILNGEDANIDGDITMADANAVVNVVLGSTEE